MRLADEWPSDDRVRPGQRFGRGVVLRAGLRLPCASRRDGHVSVLGARLRCDCGTVYETRQDFLVSGETRSCGCIRVENLLRATESGRAALARRRYPAPDTGQRFGRGVVTEPELVHARPDGTKVRVARLVCDCGNTYQARHDRLRDGRVVSCGCKRREGGTFAG